MNHTLNQFEQQIKSETDAIYLQYQEELREFCGQVSNGQTGNNEISQDIRQAFNDELYENILKKYMNMTIEKIAERIYVASPNKISAYKKRNSTFLKNKYNVIRFGLGLELPLSDFCRFLWSRGYSFPTSEFDYDLIDLYIKEGKYLDALSDYEYELTHKGEKEKIKP